MNKTMHPVAHGSALDPSTSVQDLHHMEAGAP